MVAALTAVVTLSAPGEADAHIPPYDAGAFFTNDGGAKSLLLDAAGTGTYSPSSGVISRAGSVDNYVSRIDNLAQAGASEDATAVEVNNAFRAAQVAARVLPALEGITSIAVPVLAAGAALYVGWKIGRAIDDYWTQLKLNLDGLTAGAGVSTSRWLFQSSTACTQAYGGSCWTFQVSGTVGSNVDRFCDTVSSFCGAPYNNANVKAAMQASGGDITYRAGSTGCSGDNRYTGNCGYALLSSQEMAAKLTYQGGESLPTGSAQPSWLNPASEIAVSAYTLPSDVLNATDLANARDQLDTITPTSVEQPHTTWVNITTSGGADPYQPGGSAATITVPDCLGQTQTECGDALRSAGFLGTITTYVDTPDLANTDYPADGAIVELPKAGATVQTTGVVTIDFNPAVADMPIALPQPGANETYDAYVARLQALGWLGTVTYVDLDADHADPQTGPSGVVKVDAQVGYPPSPVTTLTRVTWPLPLPHIQPSIALTIYRNPSTAPPAPTPGPLPGSGGSSCSCPPIDYSPLQNINPGSTFPFGVFTYVHDLFAQLTVTGVPITFHVTSAFTGGTGQTVVMSDSSWEATYRPRVFLVLDFLITLSAVVFFALKVLGLGGGDGDE
jgi:hypothetical protein